MPADRPHSASGVFASGRSRSFAALLRLFLAIYIPAAIGLTAVVYWWLYLQSDKQLAGIRVHTVGRIEVAAGLLAHDLDAVTADLRVLARPPSLSRFLRTGSEVDHDVLANVFLSFAEEKDYYDQLRIIDANGQERLRVNRSPTGAMVVPTSELQNKGSRYYFRDTFQLKPGEVYVSPLDLNIERQTIEVPYKPMLRIGTPIADANGDRQGIVILNVLGDELLKQFREALGKTRQGMLVNRDGYWLSHPDRSQEWGFMFGRETTFPRNYPGAWERIVAEERGSFMTPQGLFVFDTVHPLLAGHRSFSGSPLTAGMSERELKPDDYFWKIVSVVPAEELPTSILRRPGYLTGMASALLLLALVVAAMAETLSSRRRFRQSVFENELRLREITGSLGEGVYVLDRDGLITFMNAEAGRLLGWDENELIGRPGHDTFHHHTPEGSPVKASDCPVHRTIATGGTYRALNDWFVRRDGTVLPVSIVSTPIMRDGRLTGSVAAFQDISPQLQADQALRESEARFRNALEYAPIGMALVSTDGRFIEVNRALCDIVGYGKDALEQESVPALIHPDDLDAYRANTDRLFAGEVDAYRVESRFIRDDGLAVPVQLTGSVLRGRDGAPLYFIAQVEDITERKRSDEEIHRLAFYDTLTELPNRRLFVDRLERALSQAKRHHRAMAVLFLDLDHFKQVNDSLGHAIGDQLLKQVAEQLTRCLREGDTVARQGGDEFVLILTEIARPEDAARVAEKIIAALGSPFIIEGNTLRIGASIGIAIYPVDGTDDVQELMRKADIAMYFAKETGRNRFCFFADPAATAG